MTGGGDDARAGRMSGSGRGGTAGVLSQCRCRDAADGRPGVENVDPSLKVSRPELGVLSADLDEKFLDAGDVASAGSVGPARRLHLGQQFIHCVHILIMSDYRSRPQVIRGFMITRMRAASDRLA